MKRASITSLFASAIIFVTVCPVLSQQAPDPRAPHFVLEVIARNDRVLPLLRKAAKTENGNLIDTLAWLRQEVTALPDNVSEPVLAKTYNDFAKTRRTLITSSTEGGAHLIKLQVLNEITVFQERLSRSIGERDFAKWIGAMIDKYDAWLAKLY